MSNTVYVVAVRLPAGASQLFVNIQNNASDTQNGSAMMAQALGLITNY
jgi:hypothetical protein